VLGVDGFRDLYRAVEHDEDSIARVTEILLAASRTVDHPGGLGRDFVDELLPDRPTVTGGTSDYAAVNDLLTAAGAGHYLASAAAEATTGGTGTLLVRAGRVLAIGGMAASVLHGLQAGPDALAEGLATGGLGLVGAFASGPVGWVAGGFGVLLSVVFALGRRPGPPPARTYPSDRGNPGGSHYVFHVDGAGVPVAPNGG
jgi:hypothetical protein